jgi:histone deacetylase 1/2
LEKHKIQLLENLSKIKGAPSVQMHEVPPDSYYMSDEEDEDQDANGDARTSIFRSDKSRHRAEEYYDDDYDLDHDNTAE